MVSVEAEGLVHDAFVYFSADEFSAGTLPFLEEGIELGEPILAAPTERNAQLLRERLGERAEEVDWADDPESHRTVQRLATFLDYIEHHRNSGSGRIRLLGEPCWPEDGGPGVAEWKRYESYLNVALVEHPVWLVCPYDGSRLSADIVADARLTHPNIGYGKGRTSCPDYLEPSAFARRIDNVPLSPPPDDSAQGYFSKAGAVRRFVREQAERSGLARAKLRDAEIAAGEIAANVFRHAADVARVRTWDAGGTFVCDIDDTGRGIEDPFAGYGIAEPHAAAGRGLTIARRLADVVEIRTTPRGAVVRLHFVRT